MPRDASGIYTLPPTNPVVDGTIIETLWANPTLSDIAAQLNNVLTRDGLLGPTQPMRFPDGSVTVPSIAWQTQPNTGFYKSAISQIGVTINGAQVGAFGDFGYAGTAGYIRFQNGSVTAPAISWAEDTDTGFFHAANGKINVAIDGQEVGYFDSTGWVGGGGGGGGTGAPFPDGSAGAPSINWASQLNTGFFKPTTSQIGVAINGVHAGTFTTFGYVGDAGYIRFANGSAPGPAITWVGDPDTGFYWANSGAVGFTSNGVYVLSFNNVGIDGTANVLRFQSGTGATPSITWVGDTDTGLFYVGSGSFGVTCNGAQTCYFSPNNITMIGGGSQVGGLRGFSGAVDILVNGTSNVARVMTNSGAKQTAVFAQDAVVFGPQPISAGLYVTNGVSFVDLQGPTNVGIGHSTGTASGSVYAGFGYNAVGIGSVTQSGTTGVTYNTSSDYRLKDNIADLVGSGAFIDALRPRSWTWKGDNIEDAGFIAHEVQMVHPSLALGVKDAVDGEGKPIIQMMSYSTGRLIANIVAELQSLRARVLALGG